jgi:hypothetical protein
VTNVCQQKQLSKVSSVSTLLPTDIRLADGDGEKIRASPDDKQSPERIGETKDTMPMPESRRQKKLSTKTGKRANAQELKKEVEMVKLSQPYFRQLMINCQLISSGLWKSCLFLKTRGFSAFFKLRRYRDDLSLSQDFCILPLSTDNRRISSNSCRHNLSVFLEFQSAINRRISDQRSSQTALGTCAYALCTVNRTDFELLSERLQKFNQC